MPLPASGHLCLFSPYSSWMPVGGKTRVRPWPCLGWPGIFRPVGGQDRCTVIGAEAPAQCGEGALQSECGKSRKASQRKWLGIEALRNLGRRRGLGKAHKVWGLLGRGPPG